MRRILLATLAALTLTACADGDGDDEATSLLLRYEDESGRQMDVSELAQMIGGGTGAGIDFDPLHSSDSDRLGLDISESRSRFGSVTLVASPSDAHFAPNPGSSECEVMVNVSSQQLSGVGRTHAIGHALGLADTDDPADVMYSAYGEVGGTPELKDAAEARRNARTLEVCRGQ